MSWTEIISRLRWQDIADVLILTVLVFRVYLWLRGTAALQVLSGLAAVLVAATLASRAGLILTKYVLTGVAAVGSLMLVVVFQAEIRRALRRANPFRLWRRRRQTDSETDDRNEALAEALLRLARKRIGALVVIPGSDPLEEQLSGGTSMHAELAPELLEAVFSASSPIHDGAVVLTGSTLTRAGTFLPLSSSTALPLELGSRHRAAAGLAERTDAIVVVVSEERGDVSIACDDEIVAAPISSKGLARALHHAAAKRPTVGVSRTVRKQPPPRRLASAAAFVMLLGVVSMLWYAVAFDRPAVLVLSRSVELRNPPNKLEVSVKRPASGTVQVYVRGPRRLLYTTDEIRAWADLSDAHTGRQRLRIRAEAPAGLEVLRVDPAHLVIEVQKR